MRRRRAQGPPTKQTIAGAGRAAQPTCRRGLHAGAADGDASMRRAQPSGDGALAAGETGEQVSHAQQTAGSLQRLALSGDPAAHFSQEQMLFAFGGSVGVTRVRQVAPRDVGVPLRD
ncbi:hypothetical protein T484DRAFT_1921034 [Baffinella frigidus]|nr:hypothetical protein T484DRAFT_1921034 [Cryptophyta sp. CCMP2293]